MITPQEILGKGFDKAVFGGYVMEDVDAFFEVVQADYEDLYKENAFLKSKIKVLVEKLEQYRATDDTMRAALATAHKKSEDMYRETREKCRRLTRETDDKVKKTLADMQTKINAEERRLANLCANADQFVAAIRKVMDKQEEYLKELSKTTDEVKAQNPKRPEKTNSKAEKKNAESLPQPKNDSSFNRGEETITAQEINDMIASVMNEKNASDQQKKTDDKKSKQDKKNAASANSKNQSANSKDELNLDNLKFD